MVELVTIQKIPALLQRECGADVASETVRSWWQRSKSGETPNPMPPPVIFLRGEDGQPVWPAEVIVRWYRDWKSL